MVDLAGRNAIITGAGQGLGAEIARQYVISGASVLLCSRTRHDLMLIKERLTSSLGNNQQIETIVCDVSCHEDVNKLVDKSLQLFPHVDILVNNAGIYGPFGMIDEIDWKDWIRTIEINLYGTAYPCSAIFHHYRERRYGKIINLSGGGATNPLPRLSAYAASKAAVVRLTETLSYEGLDYNIDVNAVAPGALNTRLMTELLSAPPEQVGEDFYWKMKNISQQGGTPLEKGARLCAWLGSADSDGITGKLISAVWDPWSDLQNYRKDLDGTDMFTLRRIVPKDRGLTWVK
jgi:NAD(P)-dependent dehydrogenase (short-subunit alcohol dehydrogenase family)